MVEQVFIHLILPLVFSSVQKIYCTNYISINKIHWVSNRPVYMRFCSKVYYSVKIFFLKKFIYKSGICYIAFHKLIVRAVFYISQVFQVTGIGKLIQVINSIRRIFLYKKSYYV